MYTYLVVRFRERGKGRGKIFYTAAHDIDLRVYVREL